MEKPKTRLREAREKRALSLRKVQDATGIPLACLFRIETGTQVPSKDHARKLFQFYGGMVRLDQIYDPLFEFEKNSG